MRVVHSFWSKPYLKDVSSSNLMDRGKAGFLTKNLFLLTWALSTLNLRKYFDEVVLVTDDYGKRLLYDYLRLPYTEVSTELNNVSAYDTDLWAIGKVYAYSMQRKPFIHVDGDVFIWQPPSQALLKAPLICQHREVLQDLIIELMAHTFNNLDYVPKEILQFKNNIGLPGMVNAGVFGGTDIDFFQAYTKEAFRFVDDNLDAMSKIDAKAFNMIFEQYLFTCLAKDQGREVTKWLDYEVSEHFKELTDFCNLPDKLAYTHLISNHKKGIINMEQVFLRLRTEYPKYYEYFQSLFGEEIFDINQHVVSPIIA